MFKDYYKILGITYLVDSAKIRKAYREMSMKWHPDRNPDVDVTSMMQDINEAYAILKDETKRARYDQEYLAFKREFDNRKTNIRDPQNEKYRKETQKDWNYEYDINDDRLKEDIAKARDYAKSLVEEFMKTLKESSTAAAKGAVSNAAYYTAGWVIAGIILSISGIFVKSCN